MPNIALVLSGAVSLGSWEAGVLAQVVEIAGGHSEASLGFSPDG